MREKQRSQPPQLDVAAQESVPADSVPAGSGSSDVASLFLEHYLHLVRLARLLVDDRETAEEVVQDVFAAMQARRKEFPDPDAALRYLLRSVKNRSRSALRRRIVRRRHDARHLPHLRQQSPEENVVTRWEYALIRDAVSKLPRRQREVIIFRYFQDLSVAQTAAVLRITPGAVKSSASRALSSIETILAGRS